MRKQLSEKKKAVRLAIIWVLCFAVGIGLGLLIVMVTRSGKWDPQAMLEAAAPAASVTLAALYLIGSAAALSASALRVGDMRRAIDRLDPDDEDAIETIERKLNLPVIVPSVMQVVNMAVYPVLLWLLLRDSVPQALADVLFIVNCVVFVGGMVTGFVISKRSVDLEKRLNPEKRGTLLDTSFGKEWEASMDEGEKLMLWQAGYRAFRTGTAACGVLWLTAVISLFLLDTGVFPIICVCVVWLAMVLAYYRAAAKPMQRG